MRNLRKVLTRAALAAALVVPIGANAAVPIQFDPTGGGGSGAVTVGTFDWAVGNAVALGGVPVGGLTVGTQVTVLSQARLALLQTPDGAPLAIPAGVEFTFVAGFAETVATCAGSPCNNATFVFDPTRLGQNFFEIWVKTTPPTAVASNLEGTGFNASKRILYGTVADASGNFATGACLSGGSVDVFDKFLTNNYPGQLSLCGPGSTQISVQVTSIDPDYFPGFTPTQLANLKALFNTSTVVPYNQADPSRQFIGDDAGVNATDAQPFVTPTLGPVNGVNTGTTALDFQFQADANQSFEVGETVPGACRVTYGGNDRNGNIAPNSFGQACMKEKGGENCYTFGGQVGAPTANPALGGPFGEHTHHQVSGLAGDFVFRAGTRSAPKTTRITATACYDPGACRQAEANAGFKQIDFEGTGSFRTLSDTAKAYLKSKVTDPLFDPQPDNASDKIYYFRVDMDDTGEPGNKASKNRFDVTAATNFLRDDKNLPLNDPSGDPPLESYGACNTMADVYQFFICKDENRCEQKDAIYAVRAFLTGGNIQLHKVIK